MRSSWLAVFENLGDMSPLKKYQGIEYTWWSAEGVGLC